MQNIIITPQIENGRFYFDLPDGLKGSEITIQLIVKKEKNKQQEIQERLDKVRAFAAIAKDTTYEPNNNDWYNQ